MLDRAFDQAHGLRRLFAHHTVHLLPLVSNPYVPGAHMLMEGLCHGLAAQGLHTLVVDAACHPQAGGVDVAQAVARDLDLGQWIDELDAHTSVLAVSPTLGHFADGGPASSLLFEALREAAPCADVILFHADASALGGLFAHRRVRPLVMSTDEAGSLTHAYASIKILAQYGGLLQHSVVMDLPRQAMGLPLAATRLVRCAADFLGAQVTLSAVTSTATDDEATLAQTLHQLSMGLLHHAMPFSLHDSEAPAWSHAGLAAGTPAGYGAALN
jgi:hypothetical protein